MSPQKQGRTKTFLLPCFFQVPGVLSILHTCTWSMLQTSFMYFVHDAVLILARYHEELTIDVIIQKFVPMDRYVHYSLSCWGQRAVACLH